MRKIFLTALACALALAFVDPAAAAKKKADPAAAATKKKKGGRKGPRIPPEAQFQQALTRLDPQTRLEQICDREAMRRIKDEKKLPVDRAQGAASADAKDRWAQADGDGRGLSNQGRLVRADVCLRGDGRPHEGPVVRVSDRRSDPESQVGGLRVVELTRAHGVAACLDVRSASGNQNNDPCPLSMATRVLRAGFGFCGAGSVGSAPAS